MSKTMKNRYIPFASLISAFIGTGSLFASTVTKVDSAKGGVYIDEGISSGIDKDSTVCFYDADDAEIGCGKVVKAKKTKAVVKIKKKKILQKIEAGTTARLMEGEGGESEKKADKGAKGKKSAMRHRRNFKAMYVLGMVPAPYKKLSYDADPKEAKFDWKDNGSTALNISGAGAEFEFAAGSVSIALGGRFRYFFDFISTADYGQGQRAAVYVELKESGSSFGTWLDVHFLEAAMGKTSFFKMGLGLDYDASTVTLLATQKDDDKKIQDTEIINATSKASIIGIRIPLNLSFFFDPVGINLGIIPIVPVSGTSVLSATFAGQADETQSEKLKLALAHQKASFAADITLGLFAAF